jgi:hypothetical protein
MAKLTIASSSEMASIHRTLPVVTACRASVADFSIVGLGRDPLVMRVFQSEWKRFGREARNQGDL